MIVPEFWAEASERRRVDGRQFTVKRFGWSDSSETEARQHAQTRLAEALEELVERGTVRRVDHKVTYNGAEGLPIREEVVARHGDVVISRNGYGALCLNTSDVFFADIDVLPASSELYTFTAVVCLATLGWLVGSSAGGLGLALAGGIVGLLLALPLAKLLFAAVMTWRKSPEERALANIRRVSMAHPQLNLQVYRTPMGYRVLVLNEAFDPTSERALKLLSEFNSDPRYIAMCRNQRCFRARVSPKPWRMKLDRMKPKSGVWPIRQDRMAERQAWVERYQQKAGDFAACHYLMQLGADTRTDQAERVQALHDDYSQAHRTSLPVA